MVANLYSLNHTKKTVARFVFREGRGRNRQKHST